MEEVSMQDAENDKCEKCEFNNRKMCGKDFCILPYCAKDRLEQSNTKVIKNAR